MSYNFSTSVGDFEITNKIPDKTNDNFIISVYKTYSENVDLDLEINETINKEQTDKLLAFFIKKLDSGIINHFVFVYSNFEEEKIAGGVAKGLIGLFQTVDYFKPQYVPSNFIINEIIMAFDRLKGKIYKEG